MALLSYRSIVYLLFLSVFLGETSFCLSTKVYVVYMGSKTSDDPDEVLRQNHQMLSVIHGGSNEKAQASHVCSYRHGFRGFAAKLTEDQALEMARMPGVVSFFPNMKRKPHTTHSWDFMGLGSGEAMEIPGYSTKNQENVIIGFIDTGIWPESPSFHDCGMPPVPARWKGRCQSGEAFNASSCNRKVIGARYYLTGYEAEVPPQQAKSFRSPRDSDGHGSHAASIAAGRYVTNMNFNGLAAGVARGGAPMVRIAIYKTCWDSGCFDVDLLAAFDDAIKDGVHILSLSLGAPPGDYFESAISIGSFHAASHGVVVVSSIGNGGIQDSPSNLAPWMITVGAVSMDRDFTSDVVLGDGTNYAGESLTRLKTNNPTRIISASEAYAGDYTPYQSSYCIGSTLNSTKARGKVLVCRHKESIFDREASPSYLDPKLAKSIAVKEAGGVGVIFIQETDTVPAIPFVIPAAIVGTVIGDRILSYINHTRKPTAQILPAKTVIGSQPAPRVAAFSSRGPNVVTPEILKPDITAPGLNILAAWSPAFKKLNYNIASGTSMACPHVTGVVALIKAVNPSWSPSAIKSAIMTTATVLNNKGKRITVEPTGRRGTPFDYGAGFVKATKVLNPGLVYDAKPNDYKAFLCSTGYDDKSLRLVTRDNSTCNQKFPTASDLNYPSITVPNLHLRNSYSVTRTVTNVGVPRSTYRALVSSPSGIRVTVSPKLLFFNKYGQKNNFTVNFKVIAPSKGYVFGSLTWSKGNLRVTSPLVVRVASSDS